MEPISVDDAGADHRAAMRRNFVDAPIIDRSSADKKLQKRCCDKFRRRKAVLRQSAGWNVQNAGIENILETRQRGCRRALTVGSNLVTIPAVQAIALDSVKDTKARDKAETRLSHNRKDVDVLGRRRGCPLTYCSIPIAVSKLL